jgi:hypothetical protein
MRFKAEYANGTHSWNLGKRSSVSYILAAGLNLTDAEINRLISFLKTLESGLPGSHQSETSLDQRAPQPGEASSRSLPACVS